MKTCWISWIFFSMLWYLNRSFQVEGRKTAKGEQSWILTSLNIKSIEMLFFQWQLVKIQLHHSVIDLIMLEPTKHFGGKK